MALRLIRRQIREIGRIARIGQRIQIHHRERGIAGQQISHQIRADEAHPAGDQHGAGGVEAIQSGVSAHVGSFCCIGSRQIEGRVRASHVIDRMAQIDIVNPAV